MAIDGVYHQLGFSGNRKECEMLLNIFFIITASQVRRK